MEAMGKPFTKKLHRAKVTKNRRNKGIAEKKKIALSAIEKVTKKNGRPSTITAAAVVELEKLFNIDASIEQACATIGVSTDAYYRRVRGDDAFRMRMNSAQKQPFILAERVIMRAIKNNDSALALKWVERREKKRYALRTELAGVSDAPLNVSIVQYGAKQVIDAEVVDLIE